jgi:SAM-dependent methyltransferase
MPPYEHDGAVSAYAPAPPVDFARIACRLRRGALVADRVFDEVFPLAARSPSRVYWTPVEVAVRAAKLLEDGRSPVGPRTILDIGAGVGKFCIVAAAAVSAQVRGVEHRPHLVDIAREAAAKIGVSPSFTHGTLEEQDPSSIDAVYMFNPFAENLCPRVDRLDGTVELSEDKFWRDIRATERFLARAKVGTRVAIYCGFGGNMPDGYVLATRERCAGTLELWVKADEPRERSPEPRRPAHRRPPSSLH